jgi:hypothetical protein
MREALLWLKPRFEICDMPNANQANAGRHSPRNVWLSQPTKRTVVYDITINYTTQPEVAAEVVKTIEAPAIYQAGAKLRNSADFDCIVQR